MKNSLLFFLLFSINLFSQNIELGKVTKSELEEKFCPNDSSAVAAILFNKGKVSFNLDGEFEMITEVEVKIKIYKKEGYKWGNEQIPFYVGNSKVETVTFSNAITYNLVNNEIQLTKAKSENQFTEERDKNFKIKKLTMPNVKEGSIIEYKYTIKTPYISSIRDWKFQKRIPVNYSQFTTDIPEYLFYNVHSKGSFIFNETKDKLSKFISMNIRRSSWEYQTNSMVNPYSHKVDQISYLDNRTVYSLENIPAIKDELFVNNINNYSSSIEHEIAGIKLPNSDYETFLVSWDDIVKNINKSEYFGEQLNKINYFEEDLNSLLNGLDSANEKAEAIFKFVQSRMNWNEYYGYYCDEGVKKAYQSKVGNYAEINLMLVALLRYANLDANPVLVSTRPNGVKIFPSRKAYDIVIASVLIDGDLIFMDATSKDTSLKIIPTRDLNWFGRLVKKDGTSDLVDLMPKDSSLDVVNFVANIDNTGKVIGKVREQYLDYKALKFREDFFGQTNDFLIQKIEKQYKGAEINDYDLINDKNTEESIIEKYSIIETNSVESIGNKIYFSPMLHFVMSENPFKQEFREYPIDFSFPYKDKYMTSLTIPEGYQVESLPSNIAIAMDKKYGSFSYTISNENDKIQLMMVLEIATSIIPAEDYDILKEFFNKVIDKQNEKIVLKKI